MQGVVASLCVALGLLAAHGSARAQDAAESQDPHDAAARATYELGRIAFDEGDFEKALRHFRQAYELSPRPQLLYNIGTSADRLRHNREALEAFEQYLEALPNAQNAQSVRARLDVLRADIARDEELRALATQRDEAAADEDERKRKRRRRWIGAMCGALALVAAAVTVGVIVGGSEPAPYLQGDLGVQFTLTSAP